jgi:prephenate dehydrogenase
VIIATPVGVIADVMEAIAPALSPETVITDVGSVKRSVVEWAAEYLPANESRFVPVHPIAGTERSGVEASFSELFQQHRVVLTPTPVTGVDALQLVSDMWEATGAEVVEMDPVSHDEVFAACSHVPHVLAYALVDSLVRRDDHREIFHFAAGGFRDFTRIASSNPEMWRDICMANRDAIVQVLTQFAGDLDDLIAALEAGKGDKLKKTFERAKHARDTYMINNDKD